MIVMLFLIGAILATVARRQLYINFYLICMVEKSS